MPHDKHDGATTSTFRKDGYCAAALNILKGSLHEEKTVASITETTKYEPGTTCSSPPPAVGGDVRTPVRRNLKIDSVPDCGMLPLWLNDTLISNSSFEGLTTLNSTKTFRHKLSGEDKLQLQNSSESEGKELNDVSISPARCDKDGVTRTPRTKPSALADAFLEKVQQTLDQGIRHSKNIPSLRIVKSVKGRWPPQSRRPTLATSDKTQAQKNSPTTVLDINSTVSTKELTMAFENGNFCQTTDLSPKAIKEIASNRAKEESLLSPVSVKQRQRSFETSTPFQNLCDRSNRLCRSDHASTRNQRNVALSTPLLEDFDDDSTLSSHIAESGSLRSSYKIQYLGVRDWGSGAVDYGFPSAVRRCLEAPEGFSEDARASDSREWLSSQGRFDAPTSDGGLPLCYFFEDHDRRFENSATADYTAGGVPTTDRRFDGASASTESMPHLPNRSRDIYIPTVWQTRVSHSVDGNLARKWRVKRVWEHSQIKSIVIDDDETDFVVDESDLESALNSLLGIPDRIYIDGNRSFDLNSIITSSESNMSEFSGPELAQNRWDGSGGNNDPLLKKPWRIQRVWDRAGEICWVDDGKNVDGASLLEVFSNDENVPNDRLVTHGPEGILADPIKRMLKKDEKDDCVENDEDDVRLEDDDCSSDDGSNASETSGGSFVSFVEDSSLDLEELEEGLDQTSSNQVEIKSVRNLRVLRRKLGKVEKWIQELQGAKGDRTKERKLFLRLQQKCVQYLGEISTRMEEEDQERRHLVGNRSSFHLPGGISSGSQRTESNSNISNGDPHSDVGELETTPLSDTSMHSMVGNLKNLDVILEDDNSATFSRAKQRDPELIHRKIRKVKREMQKIVAKKGEKGKSRKLYRKLEEKMTLYQRELNADSTASDLGLEWKNIRRRVEQAIGVMQGTCEQVVDEDGNMGELISTAQNMRTSRSIAPISLSSLSSGGRMPSLACNNVGRWSSPLGDSSGDGNSNAKLTIHTLESVYT
ncbi:hypothetical protein IV203_031114 [Nitzschia inconspicua]|uniref:Uncharacterized protein n=1 Tax=Nitzschia inconspicua TaxID=303405 RepID=A0A9K3LXD3_9STRA|nr:hypothetical protein IV203_031114 [Nitzschia inconspicua]